MTAALTDRDMLARTMFALEGGNCCDFFACPGDQHRPVAMATCGRSAMVWEIRRYLERHGGWCREHGQELDKCHPADERPDPESCAPTNRSHSGLCHCRPVIRDKRGRLVSSDRSEVPAGHTAQTGDRS